LYFAKVTKISFVTAAKYKVMSPWRWCRWCRWCRCNETWKSAYDISNIINICVVLLLVLDNKLH